MNDSTVSKNTDSNEENLKIDKIEDEVNSANNGIADDSEEETSDSRFQEFFANSVESENPKKTETLKLFLELKNIDSELFEIEEEKGDLPDNINSIKSNIDYTENEFNIKTERQINLNAEKEKLLTENNSYEAKINKYDEQKYNVRSNSEYDEIVKSIEALFDEVKKNEARIKVIDTESETIGVEVEALENKLSELRTELGEKQALLNELDEQFKQEESALREKRNELSSKLEYESISLYDRINKMHKGEATAIVRKSNCSGCYNSIPPQRVIEIRAAEKIYTCQSCGRILISEDITSN